MKARQSLVNAGSIPESKQHFGGDGSSLRQSLDFLHDAFRQEFHRITCQKYTSISDTDIAGEDQRRLDIAFPKTQQKGRELCKWQVENPDPNKCKISGEESVWADPPRSAHTHWL